MPTSLVPCWVQTPPLLVQTHAAPAKLLSLGPSDDGRVAVGGEGHGIALSSAPHGARADQLGALLGPDAAAPRPDPRGPGDYCCRAVPPTMAVLPSAERDTEKPWSASIPRRPSRPAWFPAGSRRLPLLVQTHAAPAKLLSPGPPTMAVLPSAERDTEKPCSSGPHGARADQLGALLGPDASAPRPDPRGPSATVVVGPSDDGRVAVGGEGHGIALSSVPHGARADQLGSLLGPDAAAPRPDPRGPSAVVVDGPSDDGRVAVGGEGHGRALLSGPHGARADQLGSLLGPDAAAPRPDPRGPSVTVVVEPSDDGRVAVGGEGHGKALLSAPPRRPSRPASAPAARTALARCAKTGPWRSKQEQSGQCVGACSSFRNFSILRALQSGVARLGPCHPQRKHACAPASIGPATRRLSRRVPTDRKHRDSRGGG